MELDAEDLNRLENLNSLRISSPEEGGEVEEVEEDDYEDEEEEDEDDDDDEEVSVTLGFVEKPTNCHSLLRYSFPSKAGGVPAWLDPLNLPSGVCGICAEPMQFLLQHEQWKRIPENRSRSVKVFRSQMPRSNPFYSSEPPRHDGTDKPSGVGAPLCCWCGTWKGEKVCGNCKKAHYCSEKHQVMHWRLSHKSECRQISVLNQISNSSLNKNRNISLEIDTVASNTLWPEFEIVSEDECNFETEASEVSDHTTSLVCKDQMDETYKSLLDKFEGNDDKRSWASFQGRIAKAPEQVLRYCRDAKAKPVWPMSSGRPSKADFPKCSYCNGSLCFEFQVLPQLLYYFGVKNDVDSLDWATIVVYTCMNSCELSAGYKEEFAWVQLSSSSAI